MPPFSRRTLLTSCAAILTPQLVRAQTAFPNRPVRMLVPYPPGGSVDPVARLLATKLGEIWGQQVVVDNRPGGSTIIGTDALAKSPPDGYTLLLTASTHVSNSLLFNNLPYDWQKDFAPITPIYKAEFVLVMHPSVKANTLQELVTLAKSNSRQLSYGSSGNGNVNHIMAELFAQATGISLLHVPYKGAAPLLNDLLSGQVQLYFSVPVAVLQQLQTGRLKAIAVTGDTRMPLLPNVPTFGEAGLSKFGLRNWLGFFAPANTPKALVDTVAADLRRVLSMPDVAERMTSQGQTPFTSSPEQFASLMREDFAEYGRIIRAANIKID